MGIKKQLFCHDCKEKISVTLNKEEFKGNGPLYSIAFVHNMGSRILVATFDQKTYLRRAYCHPIHQTAQVETKTASITEYNTTDIRGTEQAGSGEYL